MKTVHEIIDEIDRILCFSHNPMLEYDMGRRVSLMALKTFILSEPEKKECDHYWDDCEYTYCTKCGVRM